MSAAIGTFSKLAIGATALVDKPLDFLSESLGIREQFIDTTGVRGTRSRPVERMRTGIRMMDGSLTLQPTAIEWSYILEWMLGGTASGTSYPIGETLAAKFITVDRITKVPTYNGVKVDQWMLSAEQGSAITLNLNLVGIDEGAYSAGPTFTAGAPAASGTFPSLTLDATVGGGPFVMTDMALTVGGTTYNPASMQISCNNFIDRGRFFNSQTLTAVNALDRLITFSATFGYGDAQPTYGLGSTGTAVVATFTNGTVSLVFSLTACCFPREPFPVMGRREIMMQLNGHSYKSASTLELVCTLDSTV